MIETESVIKSNKKISENYVMLELEIKDCEISVPGQFINILCRGKNETDPYLRRPLSIFYAERDMLQVVFKIVGRGTQLLSLLNPGDNISITGPLGKGFSISEYSNSDNNLIIAGGCGIAGVNFLMTVLNNNGFKQKLLLGMNNKNEFPFFYNDYTFNKEVIFEDEGFVTDLLKREPLEEYDNCFICGPSEMIKKCLNIIKKKIKNIEISLEERMGCGFGVCYTCPVKKSNEAGYYRVCKDGPVFKSETVKL